MRTTVRLMLVAGAAAIVSACATTEQADGPRATGYVEATEVRVSPRVPGRVAEVHVAEGQRVEADTVIARLAATEIDLALRRAAAERAQAAAQLRLVRSGAREEDVAQAEAQLAAARSDLRAAEAEQAAAAADEARFDQLLERRAGSEKQRDDAVARRTLADARVAAGADRAAAAAAAVERLRSGARPEEIDAAQARLAAVDAQIATLEHDRESAEVRTPVAGVVTARLAEPGELVSVGTPLAVLVDLDRAWVNAYVEEPIVPLLRIGEATTIRTDAGDELPGSVAFIAPRAEFTPRNVQTSAERARLVYRVRINVDNRAGVLKPGMPVEVAWAPAP